MDSRLPWLALALLAAERRKPVARLLARFPSAAEILRAPRETLAASGLAPGAVDEIVSGRAAKRAGAELTRLEKRGYVLLTFGEEAYPPLLREIFDPPPALVCSGRVEALQGPAVAIVGSRRPSAYGRAAAERLAEDLAARGVVVVSGLASGIDAAAHWGALRAGRTAAVLGSGIDAVYPPENRGLAAKIVASGGAVITEFPLGAKPLGFHFPLRNRIISGLSLGLVVVEAAARSGSLISARLALEQGREVLAVPGPVTSALSRGTHGLLKAGAALVETWEDVAAELPPPWREGLLARREEAPAPDEAALGPEERRVWGLLAVDAEATVDELVERSEFSVSELLTLLLGLELKGLAVQGPGKRFRRSR